MKATIIILSFFLSFSGTNCYSQCCNQNSFYKNQFSSIDFSKNISIDYKNIKPNSFSLYNPSTGNNDYYSFKKDTLKMCFSKIESKNIYPLNNRIDSFNPKGTSDIRAALVIGVLNLLFE